MEPQIDEITHYVLNAIHRLSYDVKKSNDSKQQEVWINTLFGFREELDAYEESISGPIPKNTVDMEGFMKIYDEIHKKDVTVKEV